MAWVGRQWSKIILYVSGIKYNVQGLDNLDTNQQYVFLSNHESALDIQLVFAALPYQLVFLSKVELKRIPFMGWAMMMGRHIFVDRKNHKAALASMDFAKDSLKKYPRSIMIFPEGTRSLDGQMKPFKRGGTVLAIETGLPVVPVAICGTFDVIKKGSFNIYPKTIGLVIGHPVSTTGLSIEDRNTVTDTLRQQVVNLKSMWSQE